MTMTAGADDDEEVSSVLRHFRPRPGFVSNGLDRGRTRRPTGPRSRQRQRRRPDRGFSNVRFAAAPSSPSGGDAGGRIGLTFLHVHSPNAENSGSSIVYVFLAFEIAVVTKSVECVRCSAPDDSLAARIKSYLDQRSEELSPRRSSSNAENGSSTAGAAASTSLFSIASRLLQLLNDDFPTSLFCDGATAIKPSPRKTESPNAMIRRVATTALQPKQSPATISALLDLQTLLLRCAAAGRNRSEICAPVPVEFAAAAGGDVGGDALARLVFAASNQLYARGFRGERQQGQTRQEQHGGLDDAARTLLAFLLSLPWTGGSRLTTESPTIDDAKNNGGDGGNSCKTTPKTRVGRLCLDVGAALGDESPAFSRRASEYGTVRAYHGTKVSSAWSILNHGLQNLSSNGALRENGAMMGEGVYLSSSRRVAESFAIKAAERPPRGLAAAFQHEALLRLLCCAGVDVASLDPLDGYDVVCLPVFEAVIIRPPPAGDVDGAASSGKVCGGDHATRQEGKYFVCADGESVRITKLHLTIELLRKPDVWRWLPSGIPVSLIVLLAAVFWIMK